MRLSLSRASGRRLGPRATTALRQQDRAEVGADVVALDLLEGIEESGRPGQAGDGVVGLVAAEAEDGGAEQFGHRLVVAVVRGFEIGRGGLGVEVVLERLGGVLGVGRVGVALGRRGAEDMLDEQRQSSRVPAGAVQAIAPLVIGTATRSPEALMAVAATAFGA